MFKKYPSMDNTYQIKSIERWKEFHPNLEEEEYIVLEKIHGTNFSIIFDPGSTPYFASRNRVLEPEEDFFGLREVVLADDHNFLMDHFIRKANDENMSWQVYGELFGPGVNKGVFYGKKRDFRLFDLRRDGFLLPHREFEAIMHSLNLEHYIAPSLGTFHGLKAALDVPVEGVSSLLTPEGYNEENVLEGIVIKPYRQILLSPVGYTFMLKKKTEKFQEVTKKAKTPKPSDEHPIVSALNQRFSRYITDQRLQNVFSKEGVISHKKEVSKYIQLLLEDAKEDFLKDEESLEMLQKLEGDPDFPKNELRKIYNVGSEPFKLLQPYL
ncbi:RNA ligase family protein [Desulfonatronovibrio magnus]|uniref:RNA ligase family protein n=1 Tax=Desulfonatronovibrio magnus TaxID=698827 RepID=UPI000697EB9E|nr:RNA ligase family protein [Desulfonatronovibrio magnus]